MIPEETNDLGTQPLDALMTKHGLSNHALVAASTEQRSHKVVQKARKGRRLTPRAKNKILSALHAALLVRADAARDESLDRRAGDSAERPEDDERVEHPALRREAVGEEGQRGDGEAEHDGSSFYQGVPDPFTATRYHSLAVVDGTVPDELVVTSRTSGGVIMGLRHVDAPVFGVQFHPESVLTEGGYRMLGNWLAAAGLPGAQVAARDLNPLVAPR